MARSPILWQAEEGSVSIGGNLYTTKVKEIAVTAPARDVDIVNMFGNQSQMFTKAAGLAECTLTAVAQDFTFTQMLLGGSDVTDPKLTSGLSTRYYLPIQYTWTDPTDANGAALRITMGSALGVSNEFSQSVDGHLEETVSFKCKPADFKVESTLYATGSALP